MAHSAKERFAVGGSNQKMESIQATDEWYDAL